MSAICGAKIFKSSSEISMCASSAIFCTSSSLIGMARTFQTIYTGSGCANEGASQIRVGYFSGGGQNFSRHAQRTALPRRRRCRPRGLNACCVDPEIKRFDDRFTQHTIQTMQEVPAHLFELLLPNVIGYRNRKRLPFERDGNGVTC